MHESCCDQYTCTEMLAKEEQLWGNLHPFDLLCYDRKSSSKNGCEEDNDYQLLAEML